MLGIIDTALVVEAQPAVKVWRIGLQGRQCADNTRGGASCSEACGDVGRLDTMPVPLAVHQLDHVVRPLLCAPSARRLIKPDSRVNSTASARRSEQTLFPR